MFIGHYGISYVLRKKQPAVSLGSYFLLVQLLDVFFFLFILLGIEKMRIVPGFTAYNAYDLYFMPYTHGLASALAWSLLAGGGFWALRKRSAVGLTVAFAVFSHWVLDLPMHAADMPIFGDSSTKLGFGLWNHLWLSLGAEIAVFTAGWFYYFSDFKKSGVPNSQKNGRKWGFFVFLLLMLIITPFMPVPTSEISIALQALGAYFVFALVAQWSDRA